MQRHRLKSCLGHQVGPGWTLHERSEIWRHFHIFDTITISVWELLEILPQNVHLGVRQWYSVTYRRYRDREAQSSTDGQSVCSFIVLTQRWRRWAEQTRWFVLRTRRICFPSTSSLINSERYKCWQAVLRTEKVSPWEFLRFLKSWVLRDKMLSDFNIFKVWELMEKTNTVVGIKYN